MALDKLELAPSNNNRVGKSRPFERWDALPGGNSERVPNRFAPAIMFCRTGKWQVATVCHCFWQCALGSLRETPPTAVGGFRRRFLKAREASALGLLRETPPTAVGGFRRRFLKAREAAALG